MKIMSLVVVVVVAQLLQSCPTLCEPMDCNLPGSSVHGIFPRQEYWSGVPLVVEMEWISPLTGSCKIPVKAFTGSELAYSRRKYGLPWRLSSKESAAMQETWIRSLGWEDPLEEGMATHSSALAQRIPWTEEPGGLQPTESHRVGHDWSSKAAATSENILPCVVNVR